MKFVVAQFILIAAIAAACFAPPHAHHRAVGGVLAVAGALLAVWTAKTLGSALTPSPRPRGPLVTGGPYRFLRHPMYVGGVLFFAGVSLAFSWLALALTGALAVLWFAKTRVEERYLLERFPDYAELRRRTLF
ncbi:MAG: methyltransferase family protein [Gaiellaceae bacterium]